MTIRRNAGGAIGTVGVALAIGLWVGAAPASPRHALATCQLIVDAPTTYSCDLTGSCAHTIPGGTLAQTPPALPPIDLTRITPCDEVNQWWLRLDLTHVDCADQNICDEGPANGLYYRLRGTTTWYLWDPVLRVEYRHLLRNYEYRYYNRDTATVTTTRGPETS